MTVKRKRKLLPCPLCGTAASVTKLQHSRGSATYNVSCGVKDDDSDSCGLVLFGGRDTRQEMVAKWNKRAAEVTHER